MVAQALDQLPEFTTTGKAAEVTVERTRDSKYGDFASNIAMRLARVAGGKPRELAQLIIHKLPESDLIDKMEVAGPGFINFYISRTAFHREIALIIDKGDQYGRGESNPDTRYLIEFVSANPTGPLHVGHGRLAAFGATLANLLQTAGYPVDREYYVNDAGRQMDILGVSVWLRALQTAGLDFAFPEAGYQGDYIRDIAATVCDRRVLTLSVELLYENVPPDAPDGDREDHIDALIERAGTLLGNEAFGALRQKSLEIIRNEIRDDLAEFGVEFDCWFSEQGLARQGHINDALSELGERNMLYEKDGATWFRATKFGDEKDRVVIRDNGMKTYFASDIAYHYHKRKRGYGMMLDILGADHHGYVARVRAGLQAMGYEKDCLEVPLVQFVSLYRGGKKLSMSTRSGEFISLRQLREEVGNDAARFFYVSRSNDQHLDFDMELAKSRSNENPVYYIQYAHARVASVFRQLQEKSLCWDSANGAANLRHLVEDHESALMSRLSRYPEIIETAARNRAPQYLVHYLRELANDFHAYYNAHLFIVEDKDLRDARLTLIVATQIVIANSLRIIGVSAPDSM